jgi:hypothetical protein
VMALVACIVVMRRRDKTTTGPLGRVK